MTDKRSKLPRKKPEQKRSGALVEAVLTATTRVLSKAGLAKLSTNKIAELAGISIGSLYQYFPNKEALIGALIEKHALHHTRILEAKIEELGPECSLSLVIDTLVTSVFEEIVRERAFLKTIVTAVFYVERVPTLIQARRKMILLIRDILLEPRFGLGLDTKAAELKSYTIVSSLGGVVETIMFDDLADSELHQRVIEQSSELVKGYLGITVKSQLPHAEKASTLGT